MPLKPKTWAIRFPSQGVVRRDVHEHVASAVAYSTPWSMNVRLEDSLTNRLRGGSFTAISAGSRPSSIIYRDRTLTFSDNAITASRQGDSSDTDLDYDVSDMQRAILFQLAEADETGEDVVALVPHKDRYLLGFTATETWILSGDPTNGSLHNISRDIGIVGADAWCVNHDTVYFLSSHGLYSIGADGNGLKALSENKIPEDLTGVTDTTCTLTYQHSDRGVYIHIADDTDWFYDVERDSFWPFDTSTADSHLLIGPLRISSPNQLGLIQTLHGILAASSAAVTWAIVTGETAEEACDDAKAAITAALAGSDYSTYVAADGAWEAGRSKTEWPRTRCAWAVVWLASEGTWAFEGLTLETVPFGRHR